MLSYDIVILLGYFFKYLFRLCYTLELSKSADNSINWYIPVRYWLYSIYKQQI